PESVRAGLGALARGPSGGLLAFQAPENSAYGPAAGRRARVVNDDGRIREGVPGEGRVVTPCLFCDGDERGERGGVPAGVSQRPPGVVARGQPQSWVRGDSERPGGEILHPVCLAGRNGGRIGGYQ